MADSKVKSTLEIENSGGVECEQCHEAKDEAVSLNVTLGAVTVMYILCQDCLTEAISKAVEDDETTTFATEG